MKMFIYKIVLFVFISVMFNGCFIFHHTSEAERWIKASADKYNCIEKISINKWNHPLSYQEDEYAICFSYDDSIRFIAQVNPKYYTKKYPDDYPNVTHRLVLDVGYTMYFNDRDPRERRQKQMVIDYPEKNKKLWTTEMVASTDNPSDSTALISFYYYLYEDKYDESVFCKVVYPEVKREIKALEADLSRVGPIRRNPK